MNIEWDFTIIDFTVILGFVLIFILFLVVRYFAKKNRNADLDRDFYKKQWKKIEQLLGFGQEMNLKLAIIEADKLLDDALQKLHFPGNTMAERLKFATYKFRKLKQVWWAHKVRNQIVHEARYSVKYGEAKKVIGLFRKAFRELNVF